MIANRQIERAKVMARAIRDAGHEVASPWVLGPIEGQDPRVPDIFKRDLLGAESSDITIAEVSLPSTGVGMELMAAHKAGKKIVIAFRKGSTVSRMLLHMEGKEVVEFEDESQLYNQLVSVLRRIHHAALTETQPRKTGEQTGLQVRREVRSSGAPAPVGPYSQAVEEDDTVYCAGQIGADPASGRAEEGVVLQTRRALMNLAAVLKAAGLGMNDIVKTSVFMVDLAEFPQMNEEYSRHFSPPYPARSTVEVSALPKGFLVEIDAIAVRKRATA